MEENVNLLEGFGAVLYKYSGKYRVFMSVPSHSGISFPAVETERGKNVGGLEVDNLITCGSVFYDTGELICGAHGVNGSNLAEIIYALNSLAGQSLPGELFLISPRLKDYSDIVKKMFPNSKMVRLREKIFSMNL